MVKNRSLKYLWYALITFVGALVLSSCSSFEESSPFQNSEQKVVMDALADIQRVTGLEFTLDEELTASVDVDYNPLSSPDPKASRYTVYKSDFAFATIAVSNLTKNTPVAIWQANVPDFEAMTQMVFTSDASPFTEPLEYDEKPAISILGIDPGPTNGTCVTQCSHITRYWKKRNEMVKRFIRKTITVASGAACAAAGGTLGGAAAGATGGYLCAVLVETLVPSFTWVVDRTTCTKNTRYCATQPNQAPKVPKPVYKEVYP